jgi:hypothetical protein
MMPVRTDSTFEPRPLVLSYPFRGLESCDGQAYEEIGLECPKEVSTLTLVSGGPKKAVKGE